ncbi:MAG TPA: spore protease YyaC [Syntrophomonadaceae bacterium]|nr:spore protease YyaC [Syntrophomonadaceae bacterium]HQA07337.1 spore protease YyaC [Syntrophomonadaceae bacterium]HQE23324.1 spore protease YyaC [Syntrophomonadaceae bacterium]
MAINKQLHTEEGLSVYYEDPLCFSRIERSVYDLLLEFNSNCSREIVFVCIGTDRATGDCLGPLVGTRLRSFNSSINVYGTLEEPTHATNLVQVLEKVHGSYRHPLIVAVDACLGSSDRVGFINIKKGSLKPGTALKKTLPEIGDFYISGVVNVGGFLEHMVLQNTRLYLVYQMADTIARGLYMAYSRFDYESRRQAAMLN